jgi:hypothetical protein
VVGGWLVGGIAPGADVVGDGLGAVVVGDGLGAVVVGDGLGAVVVGDGLGAVVVGDGLGDTLDTDGDGLGDTLDTDGDGLGDTLDTDGDGLGDDGRGLDGVGSALGVGGNGATTTVVRLTAWFTLTFDSTCKDMPKFMETGALGNCAQFTAVDPGGTALFRLGLAAHRDDVQVTLCLPNVSAFACRFVKSAQLSCCTVRLMF